MKKILAIVFAALLLMHATFAMAETPMLGGWSVAESTEITEERQALFDKALEGLLGVDYTPVAYLGSQVVSGINHCFLCKATVVYPNAEPSLKLVYIYEDAAGNIQLSMIIDLDIGMFAEMNG